jgi:hypothetical protein
MSESKHSAEIVPGSLKRNPVSGGIEFTMHCCGEFHSTVHIQNLAQFETHEQRLQVIKQYLDEHSAKHAAELAAFEFLKAYQGSQPLVGDCGCK